MLMSQIMFVCRTSVRTYHSPPEGVRVAGEMSEAVVVGSRIVLLGQVDEI